MPLPAVRLVHRRKLVILSGVAAVLDRRALRVGGHEVEARILPPTLSGESLRRRLEVAPSRPRIELATPVGRVC